MAAMQNLLPLTLHSLSHYGMSACSLPTFQSLHLKTSMSSQPASEPSLKWWNRASAPDHLFFVYLQQPLVTHLPAWMICSSTLSPLLHSHLPWHRRLHVHVAMAWAFDQNFKELCTITVAHQQEDCIRLPIHSGTRPVDWTAITVRKEASLPTSGHWKPFSQVKINTHLSEPSWTRSTVHNWSHSHPRQKSSLPELYKVAPGHSLRILAHIQNCIIVDGCQCYRNLLPVYIEHLRMSNEDSSVQQRTHAGYPACRTFQKYGPRPSHDEVMKQRASKFKRGMETLIIQVTKISDKQKRQHRQGMKATSITSKHTTV